MFVSKPYKKRFIGFFYEIFALRFSVQVSFGAEDTLAFA